MKTTHDLSLLDWTLRGWHAWNWRMTFASETGLNLLPVAGPVPARVPGSVQDALRRAEIIPDWNEGTNSLAAEWVENRHWSFETELPLDLCRQPGRKYLACGGLDYAGVIRCGHAEVGSFSSAYVPHRFEVTDAIAAHLRENSNASSVPLAIIFTDLPRNLGQINFTSRIRDPKPRFNYVWDWIPRLVQIGIWDFLRFEIVPAAAELTALRMFTEFCAEAGCGRLRVFPQATVSNGVRVQIVLARGDQTIATAESPADGREVVLEAVGIRAWWPAGMGEPALYVVSVTLLDECGTVLEEVKRRVGFREIRWTPCAGASVDAEPWILNVNGQPVFIAGVNWTPVRPNFADVTAEDTRSRIETYLSLRFNLLRVWGGAVLERESFYDQCDELGMLVWQEFPYSSSGIDNWPPEDDASVQAARAVAESYVPRRQHHASLIVWCGGNELQFGPGGSRSGGGLPVGYDHPPIAAMAEAVRRLDPSRRFLPTTPFGPRFHIDPAEIGKGRHHCVHGPWDMSGTMAEWKYSWDAADALFHSEAGVPGASSAEVIRAFCGDSGLPADASHPAWRHAASWWLQWKRYLEADGNPANLENYVGWSQRRQAEALAYAFSACREKFPRCGGFIVWMGHDCFPCPVNTSILDFHGRPKPAAFALRDVLELSSASVGRK